MQDPSLGGNIVAFMFKRVYHILQIEAFRAFVGIRGWLVPKAQLPHSQSKHRLQEGNRNENKRIFPIRGRLVDTNECMDMLRYILMQAFTMRGVVPMEACTIGGHNESMHDEQCTALELYILLRDITHASVHDEGALPCTIGGHALR